MSEIVRNPEICGGRYCIAGTRIPVRAVKSFHKAGYSIAGIRKEYPTLSTKDIKAAIAFRSPPPGAVS